MAIYLRVGCGVHFAVKMRRYSDQMRLFDTQPFSVGWRVKFELFVWTCLGEGVFGACHAVMCMLILCAWSFDTTAPGFGVSDGHKY